VRARHTDTYSAFFTVALVGANWLSSQTILTAINSNRGAVRTEIVAADVGAETVGNSLYEGRHLSPRSSAQNLLHTYRRELRPGSLRSNLRQNRRDSAGQLREEVRDTCLKF
jgi:hypothetical protein